MFKQILKQLRLKEGLTQNDLAKELGVLQAKISKYELGALEPNIKMLIKIADFFDVTLDYLVGRE